MADHYGKKVFEIASKNSKNGNETLDLVHEAFYELANYYKNNKKLSNINMEAIYNNEETEETEKIEETEETEETKENNENNEYKIRENFTNNKEYLGRGWSEVLIVLGIIGVILLVLALLSTLGPLGKQS
tara:strand:+ start:67 stop:456 length:390 start_codon:yes stop_codon:yes gene_type:complete